MSRVLMAVHARRNSSIRVITAIRAAVTLALLAVGPGALAYNRSRTDTGKALYWEKARLTYVVNTTDFRLTAGCANPGAAIRAAFPTWSGARRDGDSMPCTGFGFVNGGDTTATELGYDQTPGAVNMNLVVFRVGLCSDIGDSICQSQSTMGECVAKWNCWSHGGTYGVLALTTTVFIPETGAMVDADLELFGWDGTAASDVGYYYTCAAANAPECTNSPPNGQSGCTSVDIQSIVTHESGHMLGLAHPDDPSLSDDTDPSDDKYATMYSQVVSGETTEKRTLDIDDINGVCTIYPPLSSSSTNWATSPGLSCDSGGAGGVGLVGLVWLCWSRRRRWARQAS